MVFDMAVDLPSVASRSRRVTCRSTASTAFVYSFRVMAASSPAKPAGSQARFSPGLDRSTAFTAPEYARQASASDRSAAPPFRVR